MKSSLLVIVLATAFTANCRQLPKGTPNQASVIDVQYSSFESGEALFTTNDPGRAVSTDEIEHLTSGAVYHGFTEAEHQQRKDEKEQSTELRGKKKKNILKEMVEELESMEYNLTQAKLELKLDLKSIRDLQHNITETNKDLKIELQNIRKHQENNTDVETDIQMQLQNIKEHQVNNTDVESDIQMQIHNIREHQMNNTDVESDIQMQLQNIREHQVNNTDLESDIQMQLQNIRENQVNDTDVDSAIKIQLQTIREHQENNTEIESDTQMNLQLIKINITNSFLELKNNMAKYNSIILSALQVKKECPDGTFRSQGSQQCFLLYKDKKMHWQEAKSLCASKGLHLARPSDTVAVTLRADLREKYGNFDGCWVDARADGSTFVWQRESMILSKNSPLWYPNHPSSFTTDRCVSLVVFNNNYPRQPYYGHSCKASYDTLCEV